MTLKNDLKEELKEWADWAGDNERACDQTGRSGVVGGATFGAIHPIIDEAVSRIDSLEKDVDHLRGLLWYAWMEFNTIRARDGAPLNRDGMITVSEDYWDKLTEAFEQALGDDTNPWPSDSAKAILQEMKGSATGEE